MSYSNLCSVVAWNLVPPTALGYQPLLPLTITFARPPPLPQSHFEVKNEEGFSDLVLQNPALTNPQEARYYVGMHSARAARPIT